MKHVLRLSVLMLFCIDGFCQSYAAKENNVWAFGAYEGLDFNLKPAQSRRSVAYNHFAIGSVCDSNGKLQFYTEGTNVYDEAGQPMPNGLDITPGTYRFVGSIWTPTGESTHGVQIIPMPGQYGKYYIFSVVGYFERVRLGWYIYLGKLYYSVVDMSLNSGNGDIVPGQRGILLDSNIAMPLAGVAADQCNAYWLLAHDRYSNTFKSYNVTEAGVSSKPVLSSVGVSGSFQYGYGAIVASPDRKRLAVCSYPDAREVFDFDPSTGIVSNALLLQLPGWHAIGAPAFSPNSTKLYSIYDGNVHQFDLSSATPDISVEVSSFDPDSVILFPDLRLGPDGKIYVSPEGLPANIVRSRLGIIEFPDNVGMACQYTHRALTLEHGHMISPFPNEVPVARLLHKNTKSALSKTFCSGKDLELVATDTNSREYIWENGSTGNRRVIYTPGTYVLTYNDKSSCAFFTDSFFVSDLESIDPDLGADTIICGRQSFVLYSDIPDASYLWQDGSTDRNYTVNESGDYWLQVTSSQGCIDADSINVSFKDVRQHLPADTAVCKSDMLKMNLQANVPEGATVTWGNGSTAATITVNDTGKYWVNVFYRPDCQSSDTIVISGINCNCNVSMPTAFSPDGNGYNDFYRAVLQPECPVRNYLLKIFNRWGQLVFTSYTPLHGWDGSFNGAPCDIGTYSFTIQVEIGDDKKMFSGKGTMQLIR